MAELLIIAVGVYAGLGLLFAIAFVSFGLTRVDPTASGTGLGFRLLLIPGLTALWPWFLKRWKRS